jgi:MFS family permease
MSEQAEHLSATREPHAPDSRAAKPGRSLFWGLWSADVLSTTGGYINDVGATWLMTALSPSPLMVSLIQVVSNAPFFLLALPSGALGDIVDKRRLLLVAQIVMMLVSVLLGVLTVLGVITPGTLLLLLFVLEAFDAVAGPAWQTIIPEIVDRKDLRSAITLNSVGINVARAAGPALGGAIVAIGKTTAPAFFINAVSFLGVIIFLWLWKRKREKSALPAERLIGAMRVGVKFVRYSPRFRATLVRIGAYLLFASALTTLLPVVVRMELHRSATTYGVLLGFMGVGAVAAVPVLRQARKKVNVDSILALATVLSAAVLLALASVRSFGILCCALLAAGVGWVTVLSTVNNAAQSVLPAWVRARAMSVYLMVFFGALTLGGIVWGVVATRYGASMGMAVAAFGLVGTLILIPFFRLIEQEKLDLTPSLHWPALVAVAHLPEKGSGPVLVTVEYEVDEKQIVPFVKAMHRVRLHRLRTGAFQWGLYSDMAEPTKFVETFISESWEEHQRQHGRQTVDDRDTQESVRKFLASGAGEPVVKHLIYAGPGFVG